MASIRERIADCRAQVFYRVPYSPDMNPIEMALAKLKALLRYDPTRTFDALLERIGSMLDRLLPAECANFFQTAPSRDRCESRPSITLLAGFHTLLWRVRVVGARIGIGGGGMPGWKRRWVFGSMIAGLACVGASAAPPAGWANYVNSRYRYSICYPAMLLRPAAEAPNGDGRVFHAADGGSLAVFGRNDVARAGLDATVASDAADLAGRRGHVDYRAGRGDWRVVSGTDGSGTIFYSRTLRRGEQFAIFEFRYPASTRDRYRSVAARLSRCFTMLR